MPSEHRLHPASILFALAGSLRAFALPALVLMVSSLRSSPAAGAGSGGPWWPGRWMNSWLPDSLDLENWQVWLLVFLIPATIAAVVRYLTFRVGYEGGELVIRSGLFFRNERHVPYGRIQNLDATRTLMHRLFGVAEVRIETGGGKEPEARISVLHMTAFEEMRRRVFESRAAAGVPDAPAPALATPDEDVVSRDAAQTLLHLPVRELLLLGVLENRGFLVIAAIYGAFWEMGLQSLFWEGLTSGLYAPGLLRGAGRQLANGQLPPLWQIGVLAGGLVGLVLLVRLLSMVWAVGRLYDFRLERLGNDLRTEYGLFTRVTATIPLGRIQSLTLRDSPLRRLLGRTSVSVETAGGASRPEDGPKRPRERLAPLIRASAVPALVAAVMPQADPATLDWQGVHPRAFRRAVKPHLLLTGLPSIGLLLFLGWRVLPLVVAVISLNVLVARQQVRHLAWAANDDVVALRGGWLWRSVTIAPVAKIQTVTAIESPFDRRAAMAGVRVDTAGGSELSHRVHIPYLSREIASALASRLSGQAGRTAFRW